MRTIKLSYRRFVEDEMVVDVDHERGSDSPVGVLAAIFPNGDPYRAGFVWVRPSKAREMGQALLDAAARAEKRSSAS